MLHGSGLIMTLAVGLVAAFIARGGIRSHGARAVPGATGENGAQRFHDSIPAHPSRQPGSSGPAARDAGPGAAVTAERRGTPKQEEL
jgi:hypothetical protein